MGTPSGSAMRLKIAGAHASLSAATTISSTGVGSARRIQPPVRASSATSPEYRSGPRRVWISYWSRIGIGGLPAGVAGGGGVGSTGGCHVGEVEVGEGGPGTVDRGRGQPDDRQPAVLVDADRHRGQRAATPLDGHLDGARSGLGGAEVVEGERAEPLTGALDLGEQRPGDDRRQVAAVGSADDPPRRFDGGGVGAVAARRDGGVRRESTGHRSVVVDHVGVDDLTAALGRLAGVALGLELGDAFLVLVPSRLEAAHADGDEGGQGVDGVRTTDEEDVGGEGEHGEGPDGRPLGVLGEVRRAAGDRHRHEQHGQGHRQRLLVEELHVLEVGGGPVVGDLRIFLELGRDLVGRHLALRPSPARTAGARPRRC